MTRRVFVARTMATTAVIAGAPAFLRAQNLNNKLNLAFIACGGRGDANLAELTVVPGSAEPKGRKADGGGPEVPHPDENVTVLCDINQLALDSASQRYPKARTVTDLRRVFDRPNDFDAVVVSTAEHTHAFATYLALTHVKHVYCEKPLAYNIWETRVIRETAAKYPRLSTQMGNQGHASSSRRALREILDTGVIGPVREVHVWTDRAWGLQDAASADKFDQPHGFFNRIQIVERFEEKMPVPSTLDWDLWLGPAPERPFHATHFPGPRWYRWWDFGNGTMSDLGSHDNDVPFTVLDLWRPDGKGGRVLAPLAVESVSPNVPVPHPELAPATLQATFEFAAVGAQPALKLVWHQGDSKPPGWAESWGKRSCVFMGEKGMLLGNGKLLPEERFTGFKPPPATLPRSPGHWVEWVNHAKGDGPVPGSNFQYLRLDDRGKPPGQRGLPHGKKDRMGLPGDAGHQRTGCRSLHQAARVSQRLGGDFESVTVTVSPKNAPKRLAFDVHQPTTSLFPFVFIRVLRG